MSPLGRVGDTGGAHRTFVLRGDGSMTAPSTARLLEEKEELRLVKRLFLYRLIAAAGRSAPGNTLPDH